MASLITRILDCLSYQKKGQEREKSTDRRRDQNQGEEGPQVRPRERFEGRSLIIIKKRIGIKPSLGVHCPGEGFFHNFARKA